MCDNAIAWLFRLLFLAFPKNRHKCAPMTHRPRRCRAKNAQQILCHAGVFFLLPFLTDIQQRNLPTGRGPAPAGHEAAGFRSKKGGSV